jgi:hypothetical protein
MVRQSQREVWGIHSQKSNLLTEAVHWVLSLALIHIAEILHEATGLDLILSTCQPKYEERNFLAVAARTSKINAGEAGMLEREVYQWLI